MSSGHAYAEQPHRALAEARQQLAGLIGAEAAEMVFTASGSEANNLAIRGTVLAHDRTTPVRIITQASEHPAVLEICRALQRLHGVQVTYLPVDRDGRVDPAALAKTLTPDTALVSIMAATGHKMYAPKGIGARYVRSGVRLEPLVYGGGQERGLRAGTENVAWPSRWAPPDTWLVPNSTQAASTGSAFCGTCCTTVSMSCCPDESSSTGIATCGCRTLSTSAHRSNRR